MTTPIANPTYISNTSLPRGARSRSRPRGARTPRANPSAGPRFNRVPRPRLRARCARRACWPPLDQTVDQTAAAATLVSSSPRSTREPAAPPHDAISQMAAPSGGGAVTAQAGNRRFWLLSALRAHTKPPQKTDLLWKTPRAIKKAGGAGPRWSSRPRPYRPSARSCSPIS
jgi:hypothetical protein